MKIVLVYVGEILHCPPALSIIQIINDLDIDMLLLTVKFDKEKIISTLKNREKFKYSFIWDNYDNNISLPNKAIRMIKIKNILWSCIDQYYDNDTVIWVLSEGSLKYLGEKLIQKRYILHLLELNEAIYYVPNKRFLKLDYIKFAQNAKVVIEAEYNRAHITKAWWNLSELPTVFPNKPYNLMHIDKKSKIHSGKVVEDVLNKLSNKKIILYQGNISRERPLQEYVKAINTLGSEYAFLMMINGDNPYPDIESDNFYCLPFIAPPLHLEVTSHAYIGVLSYTPIHNDYSILNTLYCAPNKIWEYSQFGIPMIGNDLPALDYTFCKYENGICIKHLEADSIIKAISCINTDYEKYSQNAYRYFNSIDLISITKNILSKV